MLSIPAALNVNFKFIEIKLFIAEKTSLHWAKHGRFTDNLKKFKSNLRILDNEFKE